MNKDKLNPEELEKAESLLGSGVRYDMLAKFFDMDVNIIKKILKDSKKKKQLLELKSKKKFSKDDPKQISEDFDLEEEETQGPEVRRSRYAESLEKSKKVYKSVGESLDVPQDDIQRMRLLRTLGYSPYTIATTFGTSFNSINKFIRDIKPEKSIRAVKYNLNSEDIKMIKFMQEKGFSDDQIARFLGVTEICIVKAKQTHKL